MELELQVEDLDIYFYNRLTGNSLTVPAGRYDLIKVVIIEYSETISGKSNKGKNTYNLLEEANVDTTNYFAVCDYFNIAY